MISISGIDSDPNHRLYKSGGCLFKHESSVSATVHKEDDNFLLILLSSKNSFQQRATPKGRTESSKVNRNSNNLPVSSN